MGILPKQRAQILAVAKRNRLRFEPNLRPRDGHCWLPSDSRVALANGKSAITRKTLSCSSLQRELAGVECSISRLLTVWVRDRHAIDKLQDKLVDGSWRTQFTPLRGGMTTGEPSAALMRGLLLYRDEL